MSVKNNVRKNYTPYVVLSTYTPYCEKISGSRDRNATAKPNLLQFAVEREGFLA